MTSVDTTLHEVPGPGTAPELQPSRRVLGRLRLRTLVTPFVLVIASIAVWYLAQSRITDFDRDQVNTILNREFMQARLMEHIRLSALSTVLAAAVGIPSGILITRAAVGRVSRPLLWLANAGQAIPTISVLALVYTYFESGFKPALIALWIYSILPILQNTVVGIQGVDHSIVEAATGMGMSRNAVLWHIELPLASPVIVAGVRTAVVLNVGTAALASFVGAGGLGQVIDIGVTNLNDPLLYAGAGLTAILALAFDWVVALIGDLIAPHSTSVG
jgi:osmoprotectant transport system permease protein